MKAPVAGVRIREDLWKLPKWDDTLVWYARAIRKMWERALDDPTSWRYQAGIHAYDANNPLLKPLARPGDKVPANWRDVWNQCQHGSWYFLPWHRGYLGCFEAIVRETIRGLGGPADKWALPFWNYSDTTNASARLVRPEFLEAKMPDGTANALFQNIKRAPFTLKTTPLGKAGDFGLDSFEVSLNALTQRSYSAPPNVASFGGGVTGFSHGGGQATTGGLERTPHGDVHMAVGFDPVARQGYWMADFNTAGLDPLFWLHHCNLDRLWDVWLVQSTSIGNPSDPRWRTPSNAATGQRMPFILSMPGKPNFSFTPADVVDSAKSVFAYRYDGLPPRPVGKGLAAASTAPKMAAVDETPAKLIGAASGPVSLDGGSARASVAVRPQPSAPAGRHSLAPQAAPHIYLNLENIVSKGPALPYRVFLNVPHDFDPEQFVDHFVGTLPMFGVDEASRDDGPHGGSGLSYVFDVTDVVKRLGINAAETPLDVAFVPKGGDTGPAQLEVGKISFYQR
jgi:tyrosinase